MKAKTREGSVFLVHNYWNTKGDFMVFNFHNKDTYKGFIQKKNHLLIDTIEGVIDIIFSSEEPKLIFGHFEKTQLVLLIQKNKY